MTTNPEKTKEGKKFVDSRGLVERWLLCQRIGKLFYDSEIPHARLKQIEEYFKTSDALKQELFNSILQVEED